MAKLALVGADGNLRWADLALVDTVFHDDFERSDRSLHGDEAPTGHLWSATGPTTGNIVSGQFVANPAASPGAAVYGQITLDAAPQTMQGEIVLTSGTSDATMTMITSSVDHGLGSMVHIFFQRTGWTAQKRISGGSFITVAQGTYSDIADGNPRTVAIDYNGATVTIHAPDGSSTKVTDPDFATLHGQYVTWETFKESPGAVSGRWNSVSTVESVPLATLVSILRDSTKDGGKVSSAYRFRVVGASAGYDYLSVDPNNTFALYTPAQFTAALGFSGQNIGVQYSFQGKGTLPYGATVTPDLNYGEHMTIPVTNGTAFTMAAPTSGPAGSRTALITLEVANNSGGVMGAITWNAAYVFAGKTWTNPAAAKKRAATFRWNGSNWIAIDVSTADY